MKKIAIIASLLALAACNSKEPEAAAPPSPDPAASAPASPSAAPAPAPAASQTAQAEPVSDSETWACTGSMGDFRMTVSGFTMTRIGGASVLTVADAKFPAGNPLTGQGKTGTVEVYDDRYDIDGFTFQFARGSKRSMAWISEETGDVQECTRK